MLGVGFFLFNMVVVTSAAPKATTAAPKATIAAAKATTAFLKKMPAIAPAAVPKTEVPAELEVVTGAADPAFQGTTLAGNPSGLRLNPEQCTDVEEKAAVRCCGDSVEKIPSRNYGCHALETRASATAICKHNGFRLCTQPEVMAGRSNYMGCGFDMKRIWTSTPCDKRRLESKASAENSVQEKQYERTVAWDDAHKLGPLPLFSSAIMV